MPFEAIPAEDPPAPPPPTLGALVAGPPEDTDDRLAENAARPRRTGGWPGRSAARALGAAGCQLVAEGAVRDHDHVGRRAPLAGTPPKARVLGLHTPRRWISTWTPSGGHRSPTCGVLFEPEHRWLRAHATHAGQERAADLLAVTTTYAQPWADVLTPCAAMTPSPSRCCARRQTPSVHPRAPGVTMAAFGRTAPRPPPARWQQVKSEWAREVADRGAGPQRRPRLRYWPSRGTSTRSGAYSTGLANRARAGESLVHDDLGSDPRPAIEDERLIEPLFTLLGLVWKTSHESNPGSCPAPACTT